MRYSYGMFQENLQYLIFEAYNKIHIITHDSCSKQVSNSCSILGKHIKLIGTTFNEKKSNNFPLHVYNAHNIIPHLLKSKYMCVCVCV